MKKILLLICSIPLLSFGQKIMHEVRLGGDKAAYLYDNGKWSYKLYDADPNEFVDYKDRSVNDTTYCIFGIPFGSDLSFVKSVMIRKGASIDEQVEERLISYKNVKFGGREAKYVFFKFFDDKLFEGRVVFKHDLYSRTLDLYNEIKNDVSLKYGIGRSFESYDYPYEKGDGHWETALKLGKADISTFWSDGDLVTISLEIYEDFSIDLTYQDNDLVGQAVNDQTKRNITDY